MIVPGAGFRDERVAMDGERLKGALNRGERSRAACGCVRVEGA
ncbi:hypothetical protein WIS52_06165 [Pseudonocardia nematodicida]|uniref:Uncharacterized protein n=1 Tax=Pseudonocardia nematodicida TaxID=1206997 RepID=A0ABV1K6E1_9PSEU